MSFENLSKINEEKFSVETALVDEKPNVIFKGVIDLSDPGEVLAPYFSSIHDKLVETGAKDVIFDVSGLKYINSSGIKAMIKFVIKNLHVQPDKKYKITISYNSKEPWQQPSFKPVMLLAPQNVVMAPKG